VIDDQGGQLGVMQPFEAIKQPRKKLDLVEISPRLIRRFADHRLRQYLYQANKKAHEQRKSSRGSQ